MKKEVDEFPFTNENPSEQLDVMKVSKVFIYTIIFLKILKIDFCSEEVRDIVIIVEAALHVKSLEGKNLIMIIVS